MLDYVISRWLRCDYVTVMLFVLRFLLVLLLLFACVNWFILLCGFLMVIRVARLVR